MFNTPPQKREDFSKKNGVPGDSKRPFDPQVGGHLAFEGVFFHIAKFQGCDAEYLQSQWQICQRPGVLSTLISVHGSLR